MSNKNFLIKNGLSIGADNEVISSARAASLTSATITGDLTVDGSTLKVNSSNDRVGIGTTDPNMKLNISHSDQDGLRFNTTNTSESFIDFGDTDDNDVGQISYDHADNHMAFGQGTHFCLGAQLARTELQIAMSSLLRRTDNWRLVEEKNSLKHHPNVLLRGLMDLHISFDKIDNLQRPQERAQVRA